MSRLRAASTVKRTDFGRKPLDYVALNVKLSKPTAVSNISWDVAQVYVVANNKLHWRNVVKHSIMPAKLCGDDKTVRNLQSEGF